MGLKMNFLKIWASFYIFIFLFFPFFLFSFLVGKEYFELQVILQILVILVFIIFLFKLDSILLSSLKAKKGVGLKYRKILDLIIHYSYILKINPPTLFLIHKKNITCFAIENFGGKGYFILNESVISNLEDNELDLLIRLALINLKRGAFNRTVLGVTTFFANLIPTFLVKIEEKIYTFFDIVKGPQIMSLIACYFVRPIKNFSEAILFVKKSTDYVSYIKGQNDLVNLYIIIESKLKQIAESKNNLDIMGSDTFAF